MEWAGTGGRHLSPQEAEGGRHMGGVPGAGKRKALERGTAELAVVEPRAVAVETVVRVGRPAPVGLLPRERRTGQRGLAPMRSEEHTSELQSHLNLVCRLLLEKKKTMHKHARQT